VQVYDDDSAFAVFDIETPIYVTPPDDNQTYLNMIMEKLIASDTSFTINQILNEAAYLSSIEEIQSISSLLNDQSLSDKLGLLLGNEKNPGIFPQTFGPLFNYSGVRPVSKILLKFRRNELKKLLINILKNLNMSQSGYNSIRNKRSKARDALMSYINSISISSMDSVRTQAGMLSMLTSQTNEISRMNEVNFFFRFYAQIELVE